MLKEQDVSDFVGAIEKEISVHEMNERWDVMPRASTGRKKVLKLMWHLREKGIRTVP